MSRRNNGVYEPEFRLVLIIVTLILGGMSFFGFGWSLEVEDPWIGPAIFYGLQYFSVGFMTIAVGVHVPTDKAFTDLNLNRYTAISPTAIATKLQKHLQPSIFETSIVLVRRP